MIWLGIIIGYILAKQGRSIAEPDSHPLSNYEKQNLSQQYYQQGAQGEQ